MCVGTRHFGGDPTSGCYSKRLKNTKIQALVMLIIDGMMRERLRKKRVKSSRRMRRMKRMKRRR